MAFLECNFFSDVLGVATTMNVILPEKRQQRIGMKTKLSSGKLPVLYLLHGLSDDHTIWMRRTSIERYAAQYGLAVIMPDVHRSFYTDMKMGYQYWTFISQELPEIAADFFPISTQREKTFVAGLSMGGFGAFKLALNQPERFAAAASLSGVLNLAEHLQTVDSALLKKEFKLIFGSAAEIKDSVNDLYYLIESNLAADVKLPKLYQCCGTEDFLYEDNLKFRDFCFKKEIDLTYQEQSAVHEWSYWDRKIQSVLDWLPI